MLQKKTETIWSLFGNALVTHHDIVTKIYQAELSQSNKSKMVIYASMPWVTSVMKH